MLLVPIIIVTLLNYSVTGDMQTARENVWEKQLRKDLLKKNVNEPPCTNVTTVHAKFILKYFQFRDMEEILAISIWTFISWEDPRLRWNPKHYDDIEDTVLLSSVIWKPIQNLFLEKMKRGWADEDAYSYYFTPCRIFNSGSVTCPIRQNHETNCTSELVNWPYDTKNCTIEFVHTFSDSHGRVEFDVTGGLSTFGAEYGPAWIIIDRGVYVNQNHTIVSLNFVFERQAFPLMLIVVFPCVVVAVLTLISLFLKINNIRILLLVFSLIGHFFFLELVSENLPHRKPDLPSVLYFIRASFAFTITAFILTIILNIIQSQSKLMTWVVFVNDNVQNSRVNYFIFPRWKVSRHNVEVEKSRSIVESWLIFTSIINSLFLYTYLVVCIALYYTYIPSEPVE